MSLLYNHQPSKLPGGDRQWRASKHAILAYYVGGWRQGEPPLDALARALDVPPQNIASELENHSTERDEFDLLSTCLGAGWLGLSELSVRDSVALVVTLVNEKLARVPPEVRAYFGAPQKLKPLSNSSPAAGFSQSNNKPAH